MQGCCATVIVYWAPTLSLVMDKLLEAFRTGEGIPYSTYGKEILFAQGEGNRPMFVNDIARWISSIPDIESKLRSQGGNVLDVGCGDGWASISLAKSFPLIKIDAIDIDLSSINNAIDNIKEAGLSDRISVYASSIEKASLKERYDLVMREVCKRGRILKLRSYPLNILYGNFIA
jgi:SAM-dependent methyltransferase